MKVLIVSEHEPGRNWVRSSLGPGWDALPAANGLEARAIAEREVVDLVVTDETAEPYGAFGLARELKMTARPPAVIVLLERRHDSWLARWSGADRWFVRPVDSFELARAAEELVRERAPAGTGGAS